MAMIGHCYRIRPLITQVSLESLEDRFDCILYVDDMMFSV